MGEPGRAILCQHMLNQIGICGEPPELKHRPLKRAIQTKVEDALAQEILEGRVKAGDTVAVGVSKKEVKFVVKNHKELEKNDDL